MAEPVSLGRILLASTLLSVLLAHKNVFASLALMDDSTGGQPRRIASNSWGWLFIRTGISKLLEGEVQKSCAETDNNERSQFMHIKLARNTPINRLAALVLLTLCLTQLPARAQIDEGPTETIKFIYGIAPGQKARITVVNKDDSEQPIRAELKVFDVEGNQIAQRETIVPPNAFSYMEVDRDEISLRGDPTGRLEMLAKVTLFVRGHARLSGLSTVSGEIINKVTGQDSIWVDLGSPVLTCPDCRKPVPDLSTKEFVFGVETPSVGLVRGQTARISVFNDDPEQPLRAELKLFDAEGNQLAQRGIVVPPRRFRYMDVNRDDIALPGESPTGRLQESVSINFTKIATDHEPELPGLTPVPLEIVQDGRDVAIVLLVPAIQKVREAGPRP
jgi:hypothetical protein